MTSIAHLLVALCDSIALLAQLATIWFLLRLFMPQARVNWPYRLRFRRLSRKPGFVMDDHLEAEYPSLRPLLEGFTPETAGKYLGPVYSVSRLAGWETAHELVDRLESGLDPYPDDSWSGGRAELRRSIEREADLFLKRWQ